MSMTHKTQGFLERNNLNHSKCLYTKYFFYGIKNSWQLESLQKEKVKLAYIMKYERFVNHLS